MINSIFGRIAITTALFLAILFFSLFVAIIDSFKHETIAAEREQMKLQSYILLSATVIEANKIEVPDEISEQRFEQYESGLYAVVTNAQNDILWKSYSAHSTEFDPKLLVSPGNEVGKGYFTDSRKYIAYHYVVLWEVADDKPELLTFTVLVDKQPLIEKISQFENTVRTWFLILVLATGILLIITIRWLTNPLRRLIKALKDVEAGRTAQLKGRYPSEVQPLVDELNNMIVTERKQRERYRHTLANLAHSLKTPLAVMQTELDTRPVSDTGKVIDEQLARMEEIIRHQLQRAVFTQGHTTGTGIALGSCVNRIIGAMKKVYAEKSIQFVEHISPELEFLGDERDLMEVLGNIIDNACKACNNRINIDANKIDTQIVVAIHDDGAGIDQSERERVLQRGERLDTKTTGQGLGLDISRDIIDDYGGSLHIQQSPILGGALFRIELPGH